MLAIFESILPVFLLIVLGNVLRRMPLADAAGWRGLDLVSYWLLYPVMLFYTILHADFEGLQLDAILLALLATVGIAATAMLSLWPVFRAAGAASPAEFSSMFQTSIRWNGFIALAVAEKIFPPEGAAVVALAMAVIIIPLNILSVSVVSRFANRGAPWGRIARATATNPLIVGVLLGMLARLLPGGLYGPVDDAVSMISRAALGLGLIAIGAGLRPADMLSLRVALWVPVILKLAVVPFILCGVAWVLGVGGEQMAYLALCGAVPTAMNGYMLARQLGGDPEFYAAIATLQTVAAVLTMPAVLSIVAQFSSG